MFVYELSGCGCESRCSHINFRYRACFERSVLWHASNYRVWIHSGFTLKRMLDMIRTYSQLSLLWLLVFSNIPFWWKNQIFEICKIVKISCPIFTFFKTCWTWEDALFRYRRNLVFFQAVLPAIFHFKFRCWCQKRFKCNGGKSIVFWWRFNYLVLVYICRNCVKPSNSAFSCV